MGETAQRRAPLFVLLVSMCDLSSGRVVYQPEGWARALGLTTTWIEECVGRLAADDLAYWGTGGVETYAGQFPDELRRAVIPS